MEPIKQDSKVHVAHMGPTWVLSAPGRPHVCPMNLAIRDALSMQQPGGRLNKKDGLTRYGDSHVKDKTS